MATNQVWGEALHLPRYLYDNTPKKRNYIPMKKIAIFILLAFSISTFSSAADGKAAMTTVKGKSLHMTKTQKGLYIDEYKGKVLFVEFYGYKCPYCIKSIDEYNDLQSKYEDKLAIVSVEIWGYDRKQLTSFDDLYGVEYDNLTKNDAGELVPYVSSVGTYKGMVPFLAIFDKNGNYYRSFSGPVPKAQLEKIIETLSK